MRMSPYLHFNGQCEEAFKFYQRVLGARIEASFPFEGTPAADQVPAEWRKKILHARLTVAGQELLGSDPPPGRYQKPQGFSVSLDFKEQDLAEASRVFQALSENGQIGMPFGKTFWAEGFGMAVDRFGIPWIVNCEKSK